MTLIAASLNSESSSIVLVSDIMISSHSRRKAAVHMPLSGLVSAQSNIPSEYYISGTKKKCHIISDKVAVAWAGQIVMAESIVRRIVSNNVSPEDMQSAIMAEINEYDLQDRNSISFIGVSIHNRIEANNLFPLHLFAAGTGVECCDHHGFLAIYCGSGSPYFKGSFLKYARVFHENDLHGKFGGKLLPNLPLIESILEVQHREVTSGPDTDYYFGGGFNIIETEHKDGDVLLKSTCGICYLFGNINLNIVDRRLELYIHSPIVHVEEVGIDTLFIIDNVETPELKRIIHVIRSGIDKLKYYDVSSLEDYVERKTELVVMYATININNGEGMAHISIVDPNQRWFKIKKEKQRLSMYVMIEEITNSFVTKYFRR